MNTHDSAQTSNFLDPLPSVAAETDVRPSDPPSPGGQRGGHPTRVGRYQILGRLGGGGMGVVYAAQAEGDRRRVALKLIKRGMDSEALIARFELERQVLAALDHPNIARLVDAGIADDGRPYLVMEYVEGVPIDTYCDNNKLTITERLALFREVCAAVHHAHQNLIVHRDLKPGNVLVTPQGKVKLLDFGIAKLLNPDMAPVTVFTSVEMRLMTADYASPEQVRGEPITTSSDVYSLGVLLYELLTGSRPYNFKERIEQEVVRVICEEEPERPSTAVTRPPTGSAPVGETGIGTTQTLDAERRAALRDARLRDLRRQLEGELDNIVLMALRKSPKRRFASVLQLSEEIGRFLNTEPLQVARPETWHYAAGKFVQRNRTAVTVAALVAVGVCTTAATGMVLWRKAENQRVLADAERQRADTALGDLQQANQARDLLQTEAAAAAQRERDRDADATQLTQALLKVVAEDLSQLAGAAKPAQAVGRAVESYLAKAPAPDPVAGSVAELRRRADMLETVAHTLFSVRGSSVGDPDLALARLQEAVEIREALLRRGPTDDLLANEAVAARLFLGDVLARTSNTAGAEEAYARALDLAERTLDRAPTSFNNRRFLAAALLAAADAARAANRAEEAERRFQRAAGIWDRLAQEFPADQRIARDATVVAGRLAKIALARGDREGALGQQIRALRVREGVLAGDPISGRLRRDVVVASENVAGTLLEMNRPADAAPHIARAGLLAAALADEDPDNWRAHWDAGRVIILRSRGRQAAADVPGAAQDADLAVARLTASAAKFPKSAELAYTLALAHERRALAAAAAGASPAADLARADAILSALIAADDKNTEFKVDLARIRGVAANSPPTPRR